MWQINTSLGIRDFYNLFVNTLLANSHMEGLVLLFDKMFTLFDGTKKCLIHI